VIDAWAEIAQAVDEVHVAAQGGDSKISLLSAAEAADIEAVASQIIPTDDSPGAREAGVVYFVDRALATFLSQLASDYRAQLAAFQAAFRARHPSAGSFASLSLCDGSSLVTSGRGQPTMTIQALAFRAGEHIARFARRGEI
jgi:hypothetical protein